MRDCPRCGRRPLYSASDRFCLACERREWGGERRRRREPETRCGDCDAWCEPGEPLCRACGGQALTAHERAERDSEVARAES